MKVLPYLGKNMQRLCLALPQTLYVAWTAHFFILALQRECSQGALRFLSPGLSVGGLCCLPRQVRAELGSARAGISNAWAL